MSEPMSQTRRDEIEKQVGHCWMGSRHSISTCLECMIIDLLAEVDRQAAELGRTRAGLDGARTRADAFEEMHAKSKAALAEAEPIIEAAEAWGAAKRELIEAREADRVICRHTDTTDEEFAAVVKRVDRAVANEGDTFRTLSALVDPAASRTEPTT